MKHYYCNRRANILTLCFYYNYFKNDRSSEIGLKHYLFQLIEDINLVLICFRSIFCGKCLIGIKCFNVTIETF